MELWPLKYISECWKWISQTLSVILCTSKLWSKGWEYVQYIITFEAQFERKKSHIYTSREKYVHDF